MKALARLLINAHVPSPQDMTVDHRSVVRPGHRPPDPTQAVHDRQRTAAPTVRRQCVVMAMLAVLHQKRVIADRQATARTVPMATRMATRMAVLKWSIVTMNEF